jgi:nitrogen regulatory protein P-II 1
MSYKKINAIIRQGRLEATERRLRELGIPGITVTRVKGYGEYADFFNNDWMVSHARIEIFTEADRAEDIADAIIEAAHSGLEGDGIVAVLPVDTVRRVRTGSFL